MIYLAVLLLLSLCDSSYTQSETTVSMPPGLVAKLSQNAIFCIRESGADPSVLLKVKNQNFGDDKASKKFYLCSLTRTGLATPEGTLKVDKIAEMYPNGPKREALKSALEECNKKNGSDPADKMYNILKCFLESPVHVAVN